MLGLDVSLGGDHGIDTTVMGQDIRDLGLSVELHAEGFGGVGHGLIGSDALNQAVGWVVHGAEDLVGEHGEEVSGLGGGDDLGLQPPGLAKAHFALEFLQSLWSPCDLQSPNPVERALPIHFQGVEKLNRILGGLREEL